MRQWNGRLIVVSHDCELLNQVDTILELSNGRIKSYGGNYDFYCSVRNAERENLMSDYTDINKSISHLKRVHQIAQGTMVRHIAKQEKDRNNRKGITNCRTCCVMIIYVSRCR